MTLRPVRGRGARAPSSTVGGRCDPRSAVEQRAIIASLSLSLPTLASTLIRVIIMASLATTIGAGLTGTLLSCLLAGVVVQLGRSYLRSFPTERWPFGALAASMITFSLDYTAVNCAYVCAVNITHHGQSARIGQLSWYVRL